MVVFSLTKPPKTRAPTSSVELANLSSAQSQNPYRTIMDPNLELIVSLASFAVLLLYAIMTKRLNTPKSSPVRHPPPGPSPLPLFGNIHNLLFSSPLLHRTLHNLSLKHGPFYQLKLAQITLMVASTPELARQVLKDHDLTFAQRSPLLFPSLIFYGCSDILFSPYGEYWRQLRKICQMELLCPKRVHSFASVRGQEVSDLVQSILWKSKLEGGGVNLSRMLFEASCGVTSRSAFGRKLEDLTMLRSLTNDIMKMASGLGLADLFPSNGKMLKVVSKVTNFRLRKVIRGTDAILGEVLKEHRRNVKKGAETEEETEEEAEDLVDVLLKLQQSPDLQFPLTDDNIKAVLLDILVAGSQTSSATIGWIMSEMMKNPSAMQRAQAEVRRVFGNNQGHGRIDEDAAIRELQFLKCCIKEAMRLHPPVALIVRQCRTSCNVSTYDIPEKAVVAVNVWSICRDPRYWVDAERFVPDRFMNSNYVDTDRFEYIPFGAGRRMCPGISFAMANVELPVARLLYHFDWKIPGGVKCQELDMGESFGLGLAVGIRDSREF